MPRLTGPNFHYVYDDARVVRGGLPVNPVKEENWDARHQITASTSNYDYHENYKEYFDSPKPTLRCPLLPAGRQAGRDQQVGVKPAFSAFFRNKETFRNQSEHG